MKLATLALVLIPLVHGLSINTKYSDSNASALTKKWVDEDGLVVDLGYALYRGFNNGTLDGLRAWRGIRYAQPPVGDLRWRAPRPLLDSSNDTTILEATTFPPQCPQTPNAVGQAGASSEGQSSVTEDCLFLNVYSPPKAENLPVLIWIHGGGFGQGNGQDTFYEMSMNGTEQERFVVVTLQYRLGALGFASSNEIHDDGDLNVGLLDQQEVMHWVQKHIEKFGGDRTRVTIGGESAGGGSTLLHGIAYGGTLGTSLFHQLITSSPSIHKPVPYNNTEVQSTFDQFASRVGCTPDTTSAKVIMDCLRQAPVAKISEASINTSEAGVYASWAFNPVQDGHLLVNYPSRLLANKRINGKRMLAGNNAEEGARFVPQNLTTLSDAKEWLAALYYPTMSTQDLESAMNFYLPLDKGLDPHVRFATDGFGHPSVASVQSTAVGAQSLVDTFEAETTYICSSYWLADAWASSKGSNDSSSTSSWKYQHSVVPSLHATDRPAVLSGIGSPLAHEYRQAFQSIWRSFIVNGDPTSDAGLFGAQGSLHIKDHTDVDKYWVDGHRASASGGNPANLGSKWVEWNPAHPVMLNMNTTGGVLKSVESGIGSSNVTVHVEPGLKNDFSVVRGYEWESNRGARCAWWQENAWMLPA